VVNTSHDEEIPGKDEPTALTVEENLLAALLGANEALLEALRVHDDLENMALEKEAEEWSRKGGGADSAVSASLLLIIDVFSMSAPLGTSTQRNTRGVSMILMVKCFVLSRSYG
jgi:hypothetical protein